MTNSINYLTLALLVAGLFGLYLTDSKKIMTIAFTVVALVVFSINIQFWTWGFALVKLLTFTMALWILNISPGEVIGSIFSGSRSGIVFRAAALVFVLLFSIFSAPKLSEFLGMNLDQVYASVFLLLGGLLQLGISKNPFRAILGLLSFFMGFEIVYGSVERALLINGMLAAVVLLIAVIGSYLLNNQTVGEDQ